MTSNNFVQKFSRIFKKKKSAGKKFHISVQSELIEPKITSYGPIGEIVEKIIPHTESSKEALTIQLMACIGNIIGNKSYYMIESNKLYPNLFTVLVGESSWARKGTSWNHIERILNLSYNDDDEQIADQDWLDGGIKSGLSTGEGLVHYLNVRDNKLSDKRVTILESEFSSFLKKSTRDGNVISQVMRDAWDSKDISVLTKSNPLHISRPHISFVGHITNAELSLTLKEVEIYNGLANRIIWIYCKRSKLLPFGGQIEDVDFSNEIKSISNQLSNLGPLKLEKKALDYWKQIYLDLNEKRNNPFIESIVSRSPAQIIKLALIYACVDGSSKITLEQLIAAKSIWDFSEFSVGRIFKGNQLDKNLLKIYEVLKDSVTPITRTGLFKALSNNVSGKELDRIKKELIGKNLLKVEGQGKKELWSLIK